MQWRFPVVARGPSLNARLNVYRWRIQARYVHSQFYNQRRILNFHLLHGQMGQPEPESYLWAEGKAVFTACTNMGSHFLLSFNGPVNGRSVAAFRNTR